MTTRLAAAAAVSAALAALPLVAQDLKPGMPAPELSVAKWLKGDPVTQFEPGRTYAVVWWATWSDESTAAMPRLAALQKQHAKELTVVAVTSEDSFNTLELAEQAVAALFGDMPFRCAWDDDRKSLAAWMRAADVVGFPQCFVVDAAGKLAWIGDPKWLDVLMTDVLAGAEPAALAARVEAIEKRMMRIFLAAALKPETALKESGELLREFPFLTEQVEAGLFELLLEGEGVKHAWPIAERLIARAIAADDPWTLNGIAWTIVDPDEQRAERNLDVAMKAAKKAVEMTEEKDASILDTLARVHAWKGELQAAVALQRKAIAVAQAEEADEDELAGLRATLADYEKQLAGGGR